MTLSSLLESELPILANFFPEILQKKMSKYHKTFSKYLETPSLLLWQKLADFESLWAKF